MFSINSMLFCCLFISLLEYGCGLKELTSIDNDIVITGDIIRNTINKLFENFKIKAKEKSKTKDYSTIHKYFMNITLQDDENLKEIVRLVRVNYKNVNNETNFIAIINNILEEHYAGFERNETETTSTDDNVLNYIEDFLNNLQQMKEINSVDKAYVHINSELLELLEDPGQTHINTNNLTINKSKSKENVILDDNEIWVPSGRRIFQGKRTKIKNFPFIASIHIFNSFYCAGSIIKSDLILSASSCLQLAYNNRFFRENPAFLTVRVGSTFYQGGGEVIPVLEVYFYPDYDPKTLKNNICLLRLVRHLKFNRRNKRVKRIDFDRNPSNLPDVTPGITILGWGAKEHSPVIGNPFKNVLSVSILDVYPLWDCQDIYSKLYVTHKNFCAGFYSKGGGACNRDVGGPGVSDGKLIGVISFGSPVCGAPDSPTVFTKIGYYTDWIEEIMEMDVPVSRKKTTLKPLRDPFTAPPSFIPSRATTFKIPPLVGTLTPIPIQEIENQLRINDQELFKDFLKTMFSEKELAEYKDIIKVSDDDDDDAYEDGDKIVAANQYRTKLDEEVTDAPPVTETDNIVIPQTQIFDEASEEFDTENEANTLTIPDNIEQQDYKEYISKNVPENEYDKKNIPEIEYNRENYNKKIAKLMEDMNLDKIIQEEVMVPKIIKDNAEIDTGKPENEKVLTLLYLTDSEKDGNFNIGKQHNFNNNNNNGEGLSIPVEKFEDLTRAKDTVLSENDLYGLLSQVFDEAFHNITRRKS